MDFTSSMCDLIRQRRSCRKFLEKPLAEEARRTLEAFLAASGRGPFGGRARFALHAAREAGLAGGWVLEVPGIATPQAGLEDTATWRPAR